MANLSPAQASTSGQDPTEATSSNSPGSSTRATKTGRPNHWTPSRQRKLARLYLYSILPPTDIRQALEEKLEKWKPGKESTTKTVNSLLDKDPRWLRPKNREEMERRIAVLSDCTTQRKQLSRFARKSHSSQVNVPLPEAIEEDPLRLSDTYLPTEDFEANFFEEFETLSPTEFSETPVHDLLALAPNEPTGLVLSPSFASFNYSQHTFQDPEYLNSLREQSIKHSTTPSVKPEYPFTGIVPSIAKVGTTERPTLSADLDTTSLKRRLSHYSTSHMQDIIRLLETYSISDYSGASTPQVTSIIPIGYGDESTYASTVRPSSVTATSSKSGRGRLTLPSAFLFLDRYVRRQGFCQPGLKSHDSGTCWCVEDLDPGSRLWVDKSGLVNKRIDDPPRSLKHLDLQFRDVFGNTVLHFLATRGADIDVIFKALKQGVDPNAKNSAGQTFAHLFSRRFLRLMASDWNILMSVLQKLATFNFRFYDCDLFGRSFFHVLTLEANESQSNALQGLDWLDRKNRPERDAFGWIAAIDQTTQTRTTAPFQRTYSLDQLAKDPQLWREMTLDASSPSSNQSEANNGSIDIDPNHVIFKHARLLETAALAIDVPDIEDTRGRNGLQCLAEASLALGDGNESSTASNKRKRGQDDPESPATKLAFRYELVQNMIAVGVDLNNYDEDGNTVLMAFVTHLQDGEDDKTLTELLHCIIQSGANVHWRNRQGESALHIAVRLGRKVATRVLLMNGSNVHARTAEGKGVLALGEAHYLRARQTPQLYASIMACMALCIQYGAVARPSSVQEWAMKNGKNV